MKTVLFCFILPVIAISCGIPSKGNIRTTTTAIKSFNNPSKYAATITNSELKTMLYTYASDAFEGRETGKRGQKLAVQYLKEQYQNMDIPSPLGTDNYFQKVPLEKQTVAQARVLINGKRFKSFEDHIVLRTPKNIDLFSDEIIYVGYGIDADNYSDYKGIDVKDKIVLAKKGEPKDSAGNYITSKNKKPTKWTNDRQSLTSKSDAAKAHGAKALIYMDDAMFQTYAPYYQRQAESGEFGRMQLKSNTNTLPMLMVSEHLAKTLHTTITEDVTPKVLSTNLRLAITHNVKNIDSENVVAYIKGAEKPDEIVIISAHLDHIGFHKEEVCNGADDDGSGTVAILEIAEAFQRATKDGYRPKRSLLFLHVTGEEKGLLGSAYYTDNAPIFPLEQTVVNLNIDMIGRTDPKRKEGNRNYIYLIGSDKLSTDLHQISEDINTACCNIDLDYTYNAKNDPNRFYYRSDHYNFAKHNIPVIFYFNGTHEDYHKASDTPDKIEYDLLENRTRLVFYTAWEIANRSERLVVDKTLE